ncbi:MAG: DUF4434 domain-containing protein [Bacteroidales bacterium]|nr:DUF4434 domain-containing protein [Bacteroidales bacterium]
MKIKATFLDEISHDIPHQNWGTAEWDDDFAYMKEVGIEMVVLIRCGYKRWQTYPSEVLTREEQCYAPALDLVELFLQLCDKYEMQFYFGLYDSGRYWVDAEFWTDGNYEKEVAVNKLVIDEVWRNYGQYKSFSGWYLSQECSRNNGKVIEMFAHLGKYCKKVSNGLPVLISPYIDGKKNSSQFIADKQINGPITAETHEREWNEIFEGIKGAVDIVAFQDGHVEFDELVDFLRINKRLCDKHGLACWTNSETFDRDMPIKFLPIKWEKLKLKLELAAEAGIESAITFEFSHFMSPQSAYKQAGHLYNRYKEYIAP